MSKLRLTDQEIQTIIESINQDTELAPDLLKKLSPSFFEKLSQIIKIINPQVHFGLLHLTISLDETHAEVF